MAYNRTHGRAGACALAAAALLWVLAVAAFCPGTSGAAILPITGNDTTVSLTSFDLLTDAGFDLEPLGDATLDATVTPPEISFPITGGTFNTSTNVALIEHDDSGFSLEKEAERALFENFLVDTDEGLIFGRATVDDTVVSNFPLFNVDSNSLSLTLTPQAATVIDTTFGVPGLAGVEIGVASLDIATEAPIPEPSTIFLLGCGIVTLVGYGRKKCRMSLKR